MTLSDLLLPTYAQMLGTLSGWLDKAEAQRPGGGAEALLSARLAPDMFPLATQLRFACRQALEGAQLLGGPDAGPLFQRLLDEGRDAGERPGTLADARARIADTLAALRGAAATGADADPAAAVSHALPNGAVLDLTAGQYARDWALPQFYFHLLAAYAILRANGVELGKADYVAHMLPFMRLPATA